jgi:hypothetical protein
VMGRSCRGAVARGGVGGNAARSSALLDRIFLCVGARVAVQWRSVN